MLADARWIEIVECQLARRILTGGPGAFTVAADAIAIQQDALRRARRRRRRRLSGGGRRGGAFGARRLSQSRVHEGHDDGAPDGQQSLRHQSTLRSACRGSFETRSMINEESVQDSSRIVTSWGGAC